MFRQCLAVIFRTTGFAGVGILATAYKAEAAGSHHNRGRKNDAKLEKDMQDDAVETSQRIFKGQNNSDSTR